MNDMDSANTAFDRFRADKEDYFNVWTKNFFSAGYDKSGFQMVFGAEVIALGINTIVLKFDKSFTPRGVSDQLRNPVLIISSFPKKEDIYSLQGIPTQSIDQLEKVEKLENFLQHLSQELGAPLSAFFTEKLESNIGAMLNGAINEGDIDDIVSYASYIVSEHFLEVSGYSTFNLSDKKIQLRQELTDEDLEDLMKQYHYDPDLFKSENTAKLFKDIVKASVKSFQILSVLDNFTGAEDIHSDQFLLSPEGTMVCIDPMVLI